MKVEEKMPTPPVLTKHQLEEFQRDGFVVLRAAFNDADTKTIIEWADEV